MLSAMRGLESPPAGLDAAIASFLANAAGHGETTRTIQADVKLAREIPVHSDARLSPMLLGHETKEGYLVTGAIVAARADEDTWKPPYRVIADISRLLLEAGDIESPGASDTGAEPSTVRQVLPSP
jgi:hypothetical protein